MKNWYKIVSVAALLLAAASFFKPFFFDSEDKGIVFVDNVKLYGDFLLKKELEARLTHLTNERKSILDSMKIDLEKLQLSMQKNSSEGGRKEYNSRLMNYREKGEFFAQEDEKMRKEYNDQVWGQLNQYIKDFGEEKQIEIILGTSGNGNLMHGDRSRDVTQDIIDFSNEKYKGAR